MAYLSPFVAALDLRYQYSSIPPTGNQGLQVNPGTLWDYLSRKENNVSVFRDIVLKSGLAQIYNDTQADVTVFVPLDDLLLQKRSLGSIQNMTKSEAVSIVMYSTLNRQIDSSLLKSSKCLRLDTRLRRERMNSSVTDDGTIVLDERVRVVRPDLITNNSKVHLTDDICVPQEFLG